MAAVYGDEYCGVVVAAIKSNDENAGKVRVSIHRVLEIPRRGEGAAIWEQEIKLNFVKVVGRVDASKKRCYCCQCIHLSLSLSRISVPWIEEYSAE